MASVNITSHSYLCQNSLAEAIDPNRRVGCSLTSLKISLVWPQTLNTILAQHDCSKYQYLDIFHFLNVIFFFQSFHLFACLFVFKIFKFEFSRLKIAAPAPRVPPATPPYCSSPIFTTFGAKRSNRIKFKTANYKMQPQIETKKFNLMTIREKLV